MTGDDDARGAVRALVARHLPALADAPVAALGEGTDHRVLRVGDDLLVRLAKAPDADALAREARLLARVAAASPLPVPAPVFADPAAGALAYRRLGGVPLLSLPADVRAALAPAVLRDLARLLDALGRLPPAEMAALVAPDVRPANAWLDEARETYAAVRRAVPPGERRAVEAFLDAPAPDLSRAPIRFAHNDLGIEHVLVDAAFGRVTGVLDWSDAALADPAVDVGRLARDLGAAALDALAGDAETRARAVFHARCLLLEDLAYGLETGRAAYVAKGRAVLPWLFRAAG